MPPPVAFRKSDSTAARQLASRDMPLTDGQWPMPAIVVVMALSISAFAVGVWALISRQASRNTQRDHQELQDLCHQVIDSSEQQDRTISRLRLAVRSLRDYSFRLQQNNTSLEDLNLFFRHKLQAFGVLDSIGASMPTSNTRSARDPGQITSTRDAQSDEVPFKSDIFVVGDDEDEDDLGLETTAVRQGQQQKHREAPSPSFESGKPGVASCSPVVSPVPSRVTSAEARRTLEARFVPTQVYNMGRSRSFRTPNRRSLLEELADATGDDSEFEEGTDGEEETRLYHDSMVVREADGKRHATDIPLPESRPGSPDLICSASDTRQA